MKTPSVLLHDPEFADYRRDTNDQAALLDAADLVRTAHAGASPEEQADLIREHAMGMRIERMLQEEQEIAQDHGKTLSQDDLQGLVSAERTRLESLWQKNPKDRQRQRSQTQKTPQQTS